MYISISSYTYTYRYIHIHINIYIHTSSTATTTMTHPHIHRGGGGTRNQRKSAASETSRAPPQPHNHRGGGGTMTHPPGGGGGVGDAAPYIQYVVYIRKTLVMSPLHPFASQFCATKKIFDHIGNMLVFWILNPPKNSSQCFIPKGNNLQVPCEPRTKTHILHEP